VAAQPAAEPVLDRVRHGGMRECAPMVAKRSAHMFRQLRTLVIAAACAGALVLHAQQPAFVPVTHEMLLDPSPDDWLMYSRTYDAQRFSPLRQVTRQNVSQLRQVFKVEFGAGTQQSIPLVYRGVLYMIVPGAAVRALDATTGATIWEHRRPAGAPQSRAKALAIYEDMVYYTAPDGFVVALDARTGDVRWEVQTTGRMTSGALVVEGKVLVGRACSPRREDCYIAAHDAKTGEELWRFYTAAGPDEPGGETWADAPEATRAASTWGLPGGYDPERRLIYWGVANPTPNTRADRHGGDSSAIPDHSPADLYSNSTLALDPDTGKLVWYYQHLPGDDWDLDYPHERTLFRTAISPDPDHVKWINPDIPRGELRDVAVMVGEGGGLFTIDRATGQFLWATPFPFDTPQFVISHIDGRTGRVHLNRDAMFTGPADRRVVCYWNTRIYWPSAYHPRLNALYVPYVENCLDMTSAGPDRRPAERRVGIPRDGVDMDHWAGLMKIDMASGRMTPIHTNRAPINGAVLLTASDLIFLGDLNQTLRAFDADSGDVLWETTLGGPIANSTITYAVDGRQYLAVFTGEGLVTAGVIRQAGIEPARGENALYVFALP
jgi:PQQ-dependent dehydrogenase (methanol/ethanol family)